MLWVVVLMVCCGWAGAAGPIDECWKESTNRQETTACLHAKLKEAKDGWAEAYRATHASMEELDRVTGRDTALKALQASQRAFDQYRERNCAWVAAAAAGGSGAGGMALDCMIRLTRQRTAELEAQMSVREAEGGAPSAAAVPAALVGTEWRLTALHQDGKALTLSEDVVATLKFGADGRVSGRAPINGYFGAATLGADGSLAWTGPMGSTQMAGPPELMEAESAYFAALQSVTRWRLKHDALILETPDGSSRLEFRNAPR
jgi:heat shock protein HslJ